MPLVVQRSLAGGEVAPAVWGRVDQAKVQTGLATCRNFLVQRFGGVTNRSGTRYVDEVDNSADAHRLIPFVSGDSTAYLLVFGHLTMRVIKNGALVMSGMTPYSLATPYAADDLRGLHVAQDGDRMRIARRGYAPRELVRTADDAWALSILTFTPDQARPTALTATPAGAGSNPYRYQVTAISANSEESLPALQAAKAITGATKANPCVITATAHGYSNGDEVFLDGIGGMTELNGRAFTIAGVTANTFELVDEDSTAHAAYTSGGSAYRTSVRITGSAITTTSGNTVSWAAVAGARSYNIYKALNGVFGYIGTARETSFEDTNIAAATQFTPPSANNPFRTASDWPATVSSYQQRSAFASTSDDPSRVWLSRVGQPNNFTSSTPIQDDDAIDFKLAGRRVSEVRHLVEVRTLVMLTSTGAWTIQGDQARTLKPTAINPRQEEHGGAAATPSPVLVGDSVLYTQARGSSIRDLNFDAGRDGYTGGDLTLFAGHLFDGHTVVAMDYAAVPHSVVWVVRSDGALLGCTYLREQQVWGWHRHDSGGDIIEDVAVVPEDTEDAVYLLIRRAIGGNQVRYIERMMSRQIDDQITDAWFVDSGLRYDGRNTTATTLTASGGTTWAYGEPLTLTASAGTFTAGDVGNTYRLRRLGQTVDLEVTGYTSATVVTVAAIKTVPDELRAQATADWDRCVDEVAGLDHLEGREVAILADGGVQPPQVVTAGKVPLARDAAVVTVGLPIAAQIETLDIEQAEGGSLIERKKRVNRVLLLVESSRGLWAGPDAAHLREWKMRITETPGQAPALYTGTVEIPVQALHTNGGRVTIVQRDPLPLSVLAIAPGFDLGGGA